MTHDIVPFEDSPREMPGHLHSNSFHNSCSRQIADGSSSKVVRDPA
jgi:hypothetical protein